MRACLAALAVAAACAPPAPPAVAPACLDPCLWTRFADALDSGIAAGAAPGAVFAVSSRGVRYLHGTGRLGVDDPARPGPGTVFDLASLTKPLATTLAFMLLEAWGRLTLETTLGEVLATPWLPADKRPLTLKNLLAHRAGLPAWRPFYETVLAAPEAERLRLLVPRFTVRYQFGPRFYGHPMNPPKERTKAMDNPYLRYICYQPDHSIKNTPLIPHIGYDFYYTNVYHRYNQQSRVYSAWNLSISKF